MAYDRNLASVNRKLLKGSEVLQDAIRERIRAGGTIAVLDIGCGIGIALLELAWMFRHDPVRFTGINKDCGEPLASREELGQTARQIGLASEEELKDFALPELFFEDATSLHFEAESFDVVYASSVLRFVPDKAKLLEEVARVLRPGGVALIRVSSKGWDYPFGPASAPPQLTPCASRWVLKHGDGLVPLGAYLKLVSGNGIDLDLVNRPHSVIRVTKHCKGTLDLGLRLVPELSVPMTQLGYGDEDRGLTKGGIRSVYEVSDARYQALLVREPAAREDTGQCVSQLERLERGMVRRVWRRTAAIASLALTLAPMAACSSARMAAMHRLNWQGALLLGVLATLLLPAYKRSRLSSYTVGLRVNVKGRRKGAGFRAAKIKMIHHQTAGDHLEGLVDRVDPVHRTIAVLGVTASAVGCAAGPDENPLERIRHGMRVRMRGRYGHGRFEASGITVVPDSPIVVEEIQGPIQSIARAAGMLRVSGVTIVTDRETKIDRMDAR